MVTSPNQRVVVCNIEQYEKGSNKPYFICYRDSLEKAMQKIKTVGALKVWIYLQSNQTGYTLGFSPKDVSDKMGISEDSARDGFNKLVELGFIAQENGNKYSFQTLPEHKLFSLDGKKRKYKMNGKVVEYSYNELKTMFGEEADEIWEQGE